MVFQGERVWAVVFTPSSQPRHVARITKFSQIGTTPGERRRVKPIRHYSMNLLLNVFNVYMP